jgi:hypothetical protein
MLRAGIAGTIRLSERRMTLAHYLSSRLIKAIYHDHHGLAVHTYHHQSIAIHITMTERVVAAGAGRIKAKPKVIRMPS